MWRSLGVTVRRMGGWVLRTLLGDRMTQRIRAWACRRGWVAAPTPKRLAQPKWLKYQSDPLMGVVGTRDRTMDRLGRLRREDFEGKRVLDAGCCTGAVAHWVVERLGAAHVVGIEYDRLAVAEGRRLYAGMPVELRCDDLDSPLVVRERFDTVLFLAVFGRPEVANNLALLSRLASSCSVMYFQGHHFQAPLECMPPLMQHTSFAGIEFLGRTQDEGGGRTGRPFLRCDHVVRDEAFLVSWIERLARSDDAFAVAVQGKPGSGQEALARRLRAMDLPDTAVYVGPDQHGEAARAQRVVLIDPAPCAHLETTDVLFHLVVPTAARLSNLGPGEPDDLRGFAHEEPLRYNFTSFFRISGPAASEPTPA